MKQITQKQMREIERRMQNYEYAYINCQYKQARRIINGMKTYTKGTSKEIAVKKWAIIAHKKVNNRESKVGKI